ncbi:TonB-dependent receptor plug domain-containing protein [Saccharospirillum mangrovi]|uniref:TonB-dependent receptor plug domain-containing protein n=1 Tax=Saccharospirillum mangrovi TaxID=2161747 RepID=UPI000D36DA96|nr:TonB-dependent receptor [Saccharospirillum mangrovi]
MKFTALPPLLLLTAAFGSNTLWAETPQNFAGDGRQNSNAAALTLVLNQDDIRRYGDHPLSGLLARLPGINSTPAGGLSAGSPVSVRGRDLSQVVILLDGVRIGRASDGLTELDAIPIAQVKRLAWQRGPNAQYPSANGVIYIDTQTEAPRSDDLWFRSELGSHDLMTHSVNFVVQAGNSEAEGGIHYQTSAGFDANDIDNAGNADKDGTDQWGANIAVHNQWSDTLQLDLTHSQSLQLTDYDSSDCTQNCASQLRRETELMTSRLGYRYWAADGWLYEGSLFRHLDQQTLKETNTDTSTERTGLSLVGSQQLSDELFVQFGVDGVEEKLDSDTDYVDTYRSNIGLFGSGEFQVREYAVEAGARLDGHSDFDSQLTGQAALSSYIIGNVEAVIRYNAAYRLPTFDEADNAEHPAPDLDPETSETFEINLQQTVEQIDWRATYYQTHYRDLIQYDPDSNTAAVNAGSEDVQGVELEWRARSGALELTLMASYIEAGNKNNTALADFPGWSANAAVTRHRGRLSTHLDLQFEDERQSQGDSLKDLLLLGAGLDLNLGRDERTRLYARIDNLLDEAYRVQNDANGNSQKGDGRSVTVGVELHL